MSEQRLIGQLLVDSGVITESQLQEALALQPRREGKICQILMSLGYLTEEALLRSLGDQSIDAPIDVEPFVISPSLMAFVPKTFAYKHEVLPLERAGDRLTLAMAGPLNASAPAVLQEHTGLHVRPVLCDRNAVHAAIAQYYGAPDPHTFAWAEKDAAPPSSIALPHPHAVRRDAGTPAEAFPGAEAIRLRNMLIIIDSLEAFPLLPETHLRVLKELDDPEVAIRDIAPLIERDPTLAANILKLANSAAYVTRDGFASLQQAVVFLGLRQLRSTVLASSVLQLLSASAHVDLTEMFQASYHCGVLAKIICETTKIGEPDVAFTAGLLANIGRIALRMFSEEYETHIDRAMRPVESTAAYLQRSHSRVDMEEAILGVSASELGYHLAQHWRLPDVLADTIRFHDRLDRVAEPPPQTLAVALAAYCLASDAATATFGEPATDAELAWLIAAVGQQPTVLTVIEQQYRLALERTPVPTFSLA